MKISAVMFASMCVASASAFAFAGRNSASAITRSAGFGVMASSSINTVRMMSASPMDFAKSEIESNNVCITDEKRETLPWSYIFVQSLELLHSHEFVIFFSHFF